jgi:hypothetical protein
MTDQPSAPSTGEISKKYIEGWIKTREAVIDDIKDSLSFSASLTALATGGTGLIVIRSIFSSEQTWIPPTVSWWILSVALISIVLCVLLGLSGSAYGYRVLRNYRTQIVLMRKQEILILATKTNVDNIDSIGNVDNVNDPLGLCVKIEKGEFLMEDEKRQFHALVTNTRPLEQRTFLQRHLIWFLVAALTLVMAASFPPKAQDLKNRHDSQQAPSTSNSLPRPPSK